VAGSCVEGFKRFNGDSDRMCVEDANGNSTDGEWIGEPLVCEGIGYIII